MRLTFGKSEKLTSTKTIESLFATGNTLKKFPFLIRYKLYSETEQIHVKIAFSIPKKSFKKAVDRNAIRRKIKEIYRLNKTDLIEVCSEKKTSLALFLIYSAKENIPYETLEGKLKLILHDLIIKIKG